MCEVLGHKDIKKALQNNVENEYKVDLKNIEKEVGDRGYPTLSGSEHLQNFTYNECKAVYLPESLQQHVDDKRKKSLCDIKKGSGPKTGPDVLGSQHLKNSG